MRNITTLAGTLRKVANGHNAQSAPSSKDQGSNPSPHSMAGAGPFKATHGASPISPPFLRPGLVGGGSFAGLPEGGGVGGDVEGRVLPKRGFFLSPPPT